MKDWILLAVALLPAMILCLYVYHKDRVEKEPFGLLLMLLLLGALCCYPASLFEQWIGGIIDGIFGDTLKAINHGFSINPFTYYLYQFFSYFIGVALVEEGLKFFVLTYATRNNENFDSFFDGIIYAVFVSLGFAALENVLYAFSYGLQTAFLRAVTAVPGHLFFAVLMGYHYSFWHLYDRARETEDRLQKQGVLTTSKAPFSSKNSRKNTLLVPVLAHGLYDFLCVINTPWAFFGLMAFLAFMYVHCFRKIKKMSQNDRMEHSYVEAMLLMKYPQLSWEEESTSASNN